MTCGVKKLPGVYSLVNVDVVVVTFKCMNFDTGLYR